jgi:hypothetical protein
MPAPRIRSVVRDARSRRLLSAKSYGRRRRAAGLQRTRFGTCLLGVGPRLPGRRLAQTRDSPRGPTRFQKLVIAFEIRGEFKNWICTGRVPTLPAGANLTLTLDGACWAARAIPV